jgi:hypothetical protein
VGSVPPPRPVPRGYGEKMGCKPLSRPVPEGYRGKMATPAHSQPVAARLPGPAPISYRGTEDPPTDWPRQKQIEFHADREARKEIRSWFEGPFYIWTPLDDWLSTIKPSLESGVPQKHSHHTVKT